MCKALLVNIRGTNGSGKSTIPRAIIRHDKNVEYRVQAYSDAKVELVICHTYKIIFVGRYHTQCGGLDTIDTTQHVEDAIWCAVRQQDCKGYTIVCEGILASTVKSTYARIFTELSQSHWQIKPIVLFLDPPLDVCLQRIYARNGGKTINEGLVEAKLKTLHRQFGYFKEQGIQESRWDNSAVPKKAVGPRFLKTLNNWRSKYGIDCN